MRAIEKSETVRSHFSRSLRGSPSLLKPADASTRAACGEVLLESHNSSTQNASPELRIRQDRTPERHVAYCKPHVTYPPTPCRAHCSGAPRPRQEPAPHPVAPSPPL